MPAGDRHSVIIPEKDDTFADHPVSLGIMIDIITT